MATITAAGIGSGLDVNSIIGQLMALERRPLDQLDSRKTQLNAQISAFGTLKSALSTFASAMAAMRDITKFQPYAATSSNESAMGVSLGGGAAPGSFAVNVTQLASSHKLASGSFAGGGGMAIGTGTLHFTVGAESFAVTVDASNNTLAGIRDAINAASGNSKISAGIVNGTDGARLLLTSRQSGASGAIQVTVTGDGDGNDADAAGLSALTFVSGGTQHLSQITAGQDAMLSIDGFAVTSPSNDVTTAVDGVTFALKAVGSATITVNRDDKAITTAVQDFAKAYNDLKDAIAKLRSGELASDSSLRSAESALTSVLQTGANVGGNFSFLSEVGVSLDRFGKMQVDTARLASALGNNPSAVIGLFTHATEGFPVRLKAAAESLTRADGLIAGREEGLNSRIRSMESQRSQIERRLEMTEARLRAQFTALDSLVSQLQSTSAFLTQRLAALNDS
jgi:flagellar hook-associated protein 2